jgi:hypothetical protein
MSLFKINNGNLSELAKTTFAAEGIQERRDIQAALKNHIAAIAPDCLVISEEFSFWEESKRRIDLLAIDRDANLVVIELKRDDSGAHMELQALRYASMISTLTFDKACQHFQLYLDKKNENQDAKSIILDFIDVSETDIDDFAQDVRIILASADFSKELTTSVLWLREKNVDIKCVRLTPYKHGSEVLINAEQIIPVPEAEEYLIRFREKSNERKTVNSNGRDYSTYSYLEAVYNKRNLALAVMTDWVKENQPDTLADLIKVFPRSIHRGIAKKVEEISENRLDRYHSREENIITLSSDENIVISNQWSLRSITHLIEKLNEYGFDIEKIVT